MNWSMIGLSLTRPDAGAGEIFFSFWSKLGSSSSLPGSIEKRDPNWKCCTTGNFLSTWKLTWSRLHLIVSESFADQNFTYQDEVIFGPYPLIFPHRGFPRFGLLDRCVWSASGYIFIAANMALHSFNFSEITAVAYLGIREADLFLWRSTVAKFPWSDCKIWQ